METFRGKKQNKRKFPGIRGPRPDMKEFRKKTADDNVTAWRKLSPVEQISELDKRLGKGVGASKQRARIKSLVEGRKQKKSA
mgnify:CR=1 FL=1